MPGYRESVNRINQSPGNNDSVVRGYNRFQRDCAICHGADLRGPAPPRPGLKAIPTRDLSLAESYRYGNTDQAIYRTILYGIPRTPMGSYEKVYSEEEVWDLVNFLKSRWRSNPTAPPQPVLPDMTATPALPHHHTHL